MLKMILLCTGSLGTAWANYTTAATNALRVEALRVVELEAENTALQKRLRQLSQQLRQTKRNLQLAGAADNAGTDAGEVAHCRLVHGLTGCS